MADLRAGGFMAAFRGMLLADPSLPAHTALFVALGAELAPLKVTGRSSRPVKEDSLPSSGKHQHNTVTADTEDKCWE